MTRLSFKLALCAIILCTVVSENEFCEKKETCEAEEHGNLSAEIFDDKIDKSEKAEVIAEAKEKYRPVREGSLKYWGVSIDDHNPNGSLRTVDKIFKKFGHTQVNGSKGEDWDVLWSVEYPFKSAREYPQLLKSLDGYVPTLEQRINHFPGIQYITDKRSLAKYTKSSFLLPTFVFPEHKDNFTEFTKVKPDVQIIEKNPRSGGIRVIEQEQVDVRNEKKLYQAFMSSPFLIDDHAFDLGVFVVVTSVNPLRIYRYDHDVFLRFCQKEFYPFDRHDTARYVVDDNHMSAFEMDSIKEMHMKYGYSFKQIFNRIIEEYSYNADKFWKEVDKAINQIIPQHESRIMSKFIENDLNSTINCFELLRFDFIVDDKMNPYVVEVNMSPDLTPPFERFEHNALIFEHLLYNTLKLVGVGSYDDFTSRLDDNAITSNFMNIATNIEACVQGDCADDCSRSTCFICMPCLEDDFMFHMQEAYREHMRRANFKRIFPTKVHFDNQLLLDGLYSKNKMMFKWFKAQCKVDKSYC